MVELLVGPPLADEFLRSSRADIREGHGEAFYVPSRDFISMPAFEAFKGADHFYNVAFHELTHWTGNKTRLDRDLKHRFGEPDKRAFFTACSKASKAADYLRGLALAEPTGIAA